MAVVSPSSSHETLDPKPDKPDPSENPNPNPGPHENPNPDPSPNPNPSPVPVPVPVAIAVAPPPPPTFVPSFRPLGVPSAPQYSTIPNSNMMYQNPNPSHGGMQPPGVSAPVSVMPPMRPGAMYPPPSYGQVLPNGYVAGPPGVAPPGIPRYPGPYPTMVRPGFPPRPMPPMGIIPQIPRPPILGVRGIPTVVNPLVRPAVPIVAPTEKPQTTVYVGKIAPSVDNDFLLSLLRLCGPVKSWKRAQDPTDGTPKGFGFCEFEAAEGILRALRLLTKLSIDGQELVLNINQATREYLERYVEKKTEREKLKETETKAADKDSESGPIENQEPPKADVEEAKKEEDSGDKEKHDNQKFGIVTDEDRDVDRNALEKLTSMIEERIKNRPLPPPPPLPTHADTSAKSNSEMLSKSRDGDSDVDIMRGDAPQDKNDDETTSEAKAATEHDKPEARSPDRGRRHNRRSRERGDREHDLKREKEREFERYERERERERVRREKERDMKVKEAERVYRDRVKEWEDRERDKERQRRDDKEREKERQRKRRNEILKDEDGSDDDDDDDDSRKRRRRSIMLEEKRRRRQREREEDLYDRLKEEEEIAEAKKRAIEEQKQDLKPPPTYVNEENENVTMQEDGLIAEDEEMPPSQQTYETATASGNDTGDVIYKDNGGGELSVGSAAQPDTKHNNDAPTKKLGFGLVGSGKRTTVPSVFHEEDDENVDDKKMRPLVPIDYSTEELEAVQTAVSSAQPNLVAAAEFAKRISGVNSKEEKLETGREINGRSSDRTGQRERDRNDNEDTRYRNESKEKVHDKSSERERGRERDRDREDKMKTENKKLLDAKQLIDMIPKTKEELFAYEINWAVYDKHELHERMRPWISKKINDFLGEEEATLVDYIVSSTKEHVQASKMLELLQAILDDEAEMFVLKMWRMLIFEIKKVETGLSAKPRA
ncbi:RNA-binding protein 25 isoform X1 [Iris pallida]|uniref:RNA-binding protein 25 isoform X1 n=1 Tax=Iris pallida TaxID=29817 RepID=A0AAX6FCQ4_IRIPA|nr:RNA-binding protein 25 isoform X1 [Iris pallida]